MLLLIIQVFFHFLFCYNKIKRTNSTYPEKNMEVNMNTEKISYPGLYPSQETAKLGEPFNLLVVAENNNDEDVTLEICVFGKADQNWKKLTSKTCTLSARNHEHLYFTIPAQCLLPAFWEPEELDELELYINHEEPAPGTEGQLIFCEG